MIKVDNLVNVSFQLLHSLHCSVCICVEKMDFHMCLAHPLLSPRTSLKDKLTLSWQFYIRMCRYMAVFLYICVCWLLQHNWLPTPWNSVVTLLVTTVLMSFDFFYLHLVKQLKITFAQRHQWYQNWMPLAFEMWTENFSLLNIAFPSFCPII